MTKREDIKIETEGNMTKVTRTTDDSVKDIKEQIVKSIDSFDDVLAIGLYDDEDGDNDKLAALVSGKKIGIETLLEIVHSTPLLLLSKIRQNVVLDPEKLDEEDLFFLATLGLLCTRMFMAGVGEMFGDLDNDSDSDFIKKWKVALTLANKVVDSGELKEAFSHDEIMAALKKGAESVAKKEAKKKDMSEKKAKVAELKKIVEMMERLVDDADDES